MRLRVETDKNNQWMHKLNADGKIISTRPATNEEVWLYGEIDSLNSAMDLMECRLDDTSNACATYEKELSDLQAQYDSLLNERNDLAATNETFRRTIEDRGNSNEF